MTGRSKMKNVPGVHISLPVHPGANSFFTFKKGLSYLSVCHASTLTSGEGAKMSFLFPMHAWWAEC